jgi:hypothetical protein
VAPGALAGLTRYFEAEGAASIEVEISTAEDVADVVLAMKRVLTFPDWCGSSWDSVEDAFEELRQAWSFPLVLVVRGLRHLIDERPQLALRSVIQLSKLRQGFSVSGDQLIVAYVWD